MFSMARRNARLQLKHQRVLNNEGALSIVRFGLVACLYSITAKGNACKEKDIAITSKENIQMKFRRWIITSLCGENLMR